MTSESTSPDPSLPHHKAAARRPVRKRLQVARACDGCRVRRTKCDNKIPCSKCAIKGLNCSNSGIPKASTLSEARDEIAWLQERVQQLQAQIDQQRNNDNTTDDRSPNIAIQPLLSTPQESCSILNNAHRPLKRVPRGIQIRPGRSPNEAWFGLSSPYCFVHRLSVSLNNKLAQSLLAHHLLPISAKEDKLLDRPIIDDEIEFGEFSCQNTSPTKETSGVYLSLTQEEYFIDFFWQTFHTSIFPILNEMHFKRHYQSLWMPGGITRRPSALVDIVIAMCMQYYLCTLPLESQGILVEGKDAMVAGRWHYWRGQTLLAHELESPSISTLQGHLLSAIYLCGGSFQNRMENSVSLAVRAAYTLGLHIDPPSNMPDSDRELRRRLWWAIFLMDTKSGIKLGRPFMLHGSHVVMPCLPSDTIEVAAVSGSSFNPIGENSTWLSFNLYHVTLYIAVRAAYVSFEKEILHLQHDETIWDNPKILKAGAQVLAQHMQDLQRWVDSVPEPLRMKRCDGGTPFSTDSTCPSIEHFEPIWLQRQRLLLELSYHHLSISLYRPLISFTFRPQLGSTTEVIIMQCAKHAIMLSKITQHMTAETSLLDGWHEAYYCQWNAAMTLIGFLIAYPDAPLAVEARSAIDLALLVFDNFGAKFAVARNAAHIVRDLCKKIDVLPEYHQSNNELPAYTRMNNIEKSNNSPQNCLVSQISGPRSIVENINPERDVDLSAFDFNAALDIDFWNDINTLWPNMDI